MRSLDVFGMCVRNLVKRKLRTFLTLLGVIIGTGSIIIMISLGLATDAQFAQMMEDMNLDMTVVRVWPQWGGTMMTPDGMVEMERRDLTDESADRISRIPGVLVATPIMNSSLVLRSGPYAMHAWVTGIRSEALALMGHTVEYGRLLQPGGEFEAVFCPRAERNFYDTISGDGWSDRLWREVSGEEVETLVDIYNDPIRLYYDTSVLWRGMRMVSIGGGGIMMGSVGMGDDDFGGVDIEEAFNPTRSFELNIVGVLEDPGNEAFMFGGGGGDIFMDIETLQMLNMMQAETQRRQQEQGDFGTPHFSAVQGGQRETYDQLFVRVASVDDTRRVAEAIREIGYSAHFDGQWIDSQREMQQGIQTLLAAIAAISLLVAAINIANTMITSVTERTREIGVMKVIGASVADVRKLFLLESVVIGTLGGVFGVGLALGLSYVLNNFEIEFLARLNMGAPIMTAGAADAAVSLITPWLCGLAMAVAAGIGLVSGYYPAWRATRLSALAAIRTD